MPQPLTAEMEKRDHRPGFFWKKREGTNRIYSERTGLGKGFQGLLNVKNTWCFYPECSLSEGRPSGGGNGLESDRRVTLCLWGGCWWYHHQEMLGTNWKPLW